MKIKSEKKLNFFQSPFQSCIFSNYKILISNFSTPQKLYIISKIIFSDLFKLAFLNLIGVTRLGKVYLIIFRNLPFSICFCIVLCVRVVLYVFMYFVKTEYISSIQGVFWTFSRSTVMSCVLDSHQKHVLTWRKRKGERINGHRFCWREERTQTQVQSSGGEGRDGEQNRRKQEKETFEAQSNCSM